MTQKKGWGSTVLGWFIVQDEAAVGAGDDVSVDAGGSVSENPASTPSVMPAVFQSEPPPAVGGHVDFDAVFDAAGIAEEERDRVVKTIDLLQALPPDTPAQVRKQIVEASLKAFGVPIDKIIEAGVAEIQALEGYIRAGASDTQKLLEESAERIRQYEEQIQHIRHVMDQRVQEQQTIAKACNDRKLTVQQVLEFFGQEAVARVVKESPKLHDPGTLPSTTT